MKLSEIIHIVESNKYSAFFLTPPFYKNGKTLLFLDPFEIVTINKKKNVNEKLNLIDEFIAKGFKGYTLINYEAGYLFERKLEKLLSGNEEKLIRFLFFNDENIFKINAEEIEFDSGDITNYSLNNFNLSTSQPIIIRNIEKIKNYIKEGDTYQVNYTVKAKFNFSGSYSSFLQHLLFNQSAKYSAFINDDDKFIISLSPEKFFSIKGDKIFSNPMKGTIKRGVNISADNECEHNLYNSKKNRAENVMIVDLIRNDLGRIAKYGSVSVPNLFTTEKYESLIQMVSTITADLNKEIALTEILKNIFPCGSITGAPKIRTMEIIKKLENEERGIYTGSIGLITKSKSVFNVPIRTLTINKSNGNGELGIGAGIVWDSVAKKEYEETLLKSNFLTQPENYFELFETMLVKNNKISFLKEHINRLKVASEFFLFNFDESKIEKMLIEEAGQLNANKKYKLKLILNKWGSIKTKISDFPIEKEEVKIILSEKRINSGNRFQYFKTTNRSIYDKEYKKYSAKGFFDVLFLNEKNEVAEGCITNIFVKKGNNWFTPPLSSGILNGIYRGKLLKKKEFSEKVITIDDITNADSIKLVNSVRGEIAVNKLYSEDKYVDF